MPDTILSAFSVWADARVELGLNSKPALVSYQPPCSCVLSTLLSPDPRGERKRGMYWHHQPLHGTAQWESEIQVRPSCKQPGLEQTLRLRLSQWNLGGLERVAHGFSTSLGLWSSIFSLNLLDAWNLSHTSEEFFYRWTRERLHDIGGWQPGFPSWVMDL